MMEKAEFPKLELLSPPSSPSYNNDNNNINNNNNNVGFELEENINKIWDNHHHHHHIKAYEYRADKGDSFVIDMDSFSSAITNAAAPSPNSRTKLQRSLSRKGSLRGVDRKVNGNATALHDKDTVPSTCSPRAAMVGSCSTPEKAAVVSMDNSMNPHVHHQITITASNMNGAAATENRCITRRNSFRRVSSWGIDPKRVLLFFATLSSMGTMLLIYFTLTISKQNEDEYYYASDLKQ